METKTQESVDKFIALSEPRLTGKELTLIKECLDTNWVSTAGPFVSAFEEKIAGYVGGKYGVATNSGTSALHTALIVAGIKQDDEVIMPAISFVAPANAVRYQGAYPVFIDAESQYWQLDCKKLADFCENECTFKNETLINNHTSREVKAIIPVHVLGHPVDMDPIVEIAKKYNLVVIEDAAEAIGAAYKGRKVGSIGDISCFSFNGNKTITASGGGMIVTNNEKWAKKAQYLTTQAKDDPIESIHDEIGFNYRLTNIQAAFGCAQLESLDEFIAVKKLNARIYSDCLKGIDGISWQEQASWAESTSWLFTVLIDDTKVKNSSRRLLEILQENQIQSRPLWHPLHSLKPFANCYAHQIEVANKLYLQSLSLPSSIGLKKDDIERIAQIIKDNS